jgi:predicted RNA binding protein YcfA (HicA-like mRNA interferase family)
MWELNYNYFDVVRRLKKLWYTLKRQAKWSHEIWMNKEGNFVVVPNRWKRTLTKGVIKSIIKRLGLTNEEFKKLI